MDILSNPTVKTNQPAGQFLASPVSSSGDGAFRSFSITNIPALNSLLAVTPAGDDSVFIYDQSGTQNARATINAIFSLALKGYKAGLAISWVSGTQVKVGVGVAHIESTDSLVQLTSEQTLTPSLSASSFHYIYLTSTGTVEVSTTAPAAPYYGFARSKTSDSSRRCIGFFLTDSSSSIQNFFYNVTSGEFKWLVNNTLSPYRVLTGGTANGGTSTTLTDVDCSAVIPPICNLVKMHVFSYNTPAGTNLFLGASGSTRGTNNVNTYATINPATEPTHTIPVNSSRIFGYIFNLSPSPGAAYIDIEGGFAPL